MQIASAIGASSIFPTLLPVDVCANERLTVLIPTRVWGARETIISASFVMTFHHGVSATFDMGRTVYLREEQHVGRDSVTLTHYILADDGTFLP